MSEYVCEPRLWKGKKFHLRSYFLVSVVGGVFRSYLMPTHHVELSCKPFCMEDLDDLDVHGYNCYRALQEDRNQSFDQAAEAGFTDAEVADVLQQMRTILQAVSAMYKEHAAPYRESRHAFEVFGVDFLIRNPTSVVLLEINNKVGLGDFSETWAKKFSGVYFDFIDAAVFRPMLAGQPCTLDPIFTA